MKVLLVVNSAASSVTPERRVVIQKAARGRPRRRAWSRPTAAGHATRARPGRGRRRASTWSWCSAATAPSTRRPTASSAPTTALAAAAGRVDQRVRPHPRAARTTRSRPPRDLLEALGQPDRSHRVGLGSVNGRYFFFHVGRRLGRRRGRAGRAAGDAEALGRPPAVHLRRRSTPGSGTTTAATRTSPCLRRRRRWSTTATSPSCLNTNPYTYVGNRPLRPRPRRHPRPRRWPIVTVRTHAPSPFLRLIARRSSRDADLRGAALDRLPHRRHRARRSTATAGPLPGRRRLPRRDRAARVPPRARGARPGHALQPGRPQRTFVPSISDLPLCPGPLRIANLGPCRRPDVSNEAQLVCTRRNLLIGVAGGGGEGRRGGAGRQRPRRRLEPERRQRSRHRARPR